MDCRTRALGFLFFLKIFQKVLPVSCTIPIQALNIRRLFRPAECMILLQTLHTSARLPYLPSTRLDVRGVVGHPHDVCHRSLANSVGGIAINPLHECRQVAADPVDCTCPWPIPTINKLSEIL
ncbi:hypothetical protein B0T18DRAFT_397766 [Schizothecium vesticola]|uniref:Secreted protein n=1 Tax=Schizothecium vesticola TaxID=314040 RepID=A0AA40F9L2_9PEZI|nr:hypothetical protein B0T18DRAFT_397766 [Schizothecium vesticola]